MILLALGLLIFAGVLPLHRRARASTANKEPEARKKEKGDNWAQRALREPRLLIAFAIGALVGLPGAAYLAALHNLITGKYSTATQVIAVIVFVIIEFLLIIVPWLCLELWPATTAAFLKRAQDWLTGHARQLIAYTAMILGAYMAISGLVQLT